MEAHEDSADSDGAPYRRVGQTTWYDASEVAHELERPNLVSAFGPAGVVETGEIEEDEDEEDGKDADAEGAVTSDDEQDREAQREHAAHLASLKIKKVIKCPGCDARITQVGYTRHARSNRKCGLYDPSATLETVRFSKRQCYALAHVCLVCLGEIRVV